MIGLAQARYRPYPGTLGAPERVPTTAGWKTPARELVAEFNTDQKRAPAAGEIAILQRLAVRANAILKRPNIVAGHPSREDEMDWNSAQGLINFYLVHGRGPDGHDPAAPQRGGPEIEALVKAAVSAVPSKDSWLKSALHTVTAPVRAVEHVASKIEHEVEKIPVLGDVTHVIAEIYTAPLKIAENIASGARLDHVALGALKDQLKIAKDVAPYAQTVVSLVPGVGTGVAAAIGMGAALAEGQSITNAAKSAIRGAIPGGPLVQAGFDMALKVGSGENVGKAALESARAALPPSAQSAFDIGLAVVTGEKIQTALAKGLANMAPEAMKTVLAAGQKAIDSTPGLATALKSVANNVEASKGFQLAAGLVGQKGVGEKAITAVRDQLPPAVRQGFDVALKTQEPHIAWLKNVTSAPAAAAPVTSSIAATIKAVPPPKAPLVVHEPPKTKPSGPVVHEPPKKTAASGPIVHEPPKNTARLARLAKYAPYPKSVGVSAVGVGFFSSDARWRWFTVFANGRPIAQRGPIWLSNSDAQREAESFLEATLGRDYVGAVTRWDWDGQAWHQASGYGLSAPPHGGGGHGGGGGHHSGGRGRPVLRRGGRGAPGRWNDYYPLPAEVVTKTETCTTWSDLVPIPPSMVQAVKQAIGSSGGRPTTMRSDDGALYLFTAEDGGIAARRCVTVGVGGWASDAWNDWSSEVKSLWYG